MEKQLNALKVIATTRYIRAFLGENDPMALKQVEGAIVDAERQLTEEQTTGVMVREWEVIRHKLGLFMGSTPKANIGCLIEAMLDLTDVEFRMWLNYCNTYENFHPSHFKSQEDQFIKTGKWDWVVKEVKYNG